MNTSKQVLRLSIPLQWLSFQFAYYPRTGCFQYRNATESYAGLPCFMNMGCKLHSHQVSKVFCFGIHATAMPLQIIKSLLLKYCFGFAHSSTIEINCSSSSVFAGWRGRYTLIHRRMFTDTHTQNILVCVLEILFAGKP